VKQFFASLLCAALLACGQSAVLAQTGAAPAVTSCPAGSKLVEAYTKKSGTTVAAHCKKSKHAKGGAMNAAAPDAAASTVPGVPAPAAAAPAPVLTPSPAMRKSTSTGTASQAAPDPAETTCPAGKTYVHSYTTKKGKTVAGYCRKSHAKKSPT
jgi:hypothetical protein